MIGESFVPIFACSSSDALHFRMCVKSVVAAVRINVASIVFDAESDWFPDEAVALNAIPTAPSS